MMPPGAVFLIFNLLPKLIIPALIFYALLRLAPFPLPAPIRIGLVTALNPTLFFLRARLKYAHTNRAASRLGAVPVPHITGKWFAGADFVWKLVKLQKTEYVNDFLAQLSSQLGKTFSMRMLGEDVVCWHLFIVSIVTSDERSPHQFFTSEPQHIKQMLATNFTNV